MKRLGIIIIFLLTLSSCISIEKVSSSSNKEVNTTINSSNVVKPKDDIKDINNADILKDKNKINQVFDRNKRNYNYHLKAVWVASVGNLDFPSRSGLSISQLKAEYIRLLDNCQKMGINAIFYQIKPGADAMYKTNYWPTSRYLVENEGDAFNFDLLSYMIEEAHKRGIEFHAWINPYRVSTINDYSKISKKSIVAQHPEWTFVYNNQIFFNPGIPEVVSYVSKSIEEVVKNYNVDGIHLDDYFYPYPVEGQTIPDTYEYKMYGRKFATIEDFRRNNVNEMIKNLSVSIHKINPKIVFGVSPFGIWRNYSTTSIGSKTSGLESYDRLYADSILWMEKGWVDYIAPQIYWAIGKKGSDYEVLTKWWNNQALRTNTVLYIGHGIYKYARKNNHDIWYNRNELKDQLEMNRNLKGVKGSIFFRYGTFIEFPFIIDQMRYE